MFSIEAGDQAGSYLMPPVPQEHLGGTRAPACRRDGSPVGSSRLRAPVQGLASIAARPSTILFIFQDTGEKA